MLKILGSYKNGNYNVLILNDGTKIRKTDEDEFIPEFPESMDVKITNKCTGTNCPFCHENSSKDGLHGDILNVKFLDTLNPFTELAIGGGNPLEHPDLIPFLEKCKNLKLIPSMTVNQFHFMKNQELINYLVENELIYGLGVSLVNPSNNFIETISKYKNAVIHVINGVHKLEDIKKLYNKNLKILILGYKFFRRGENYYSEEVEKIKTNIYNNLEEITKNFSVVSFDNLAITQLEPRRLFNTQKEYDEFFLGEDGSHTMYVDLVQKEFAISSTSKVRYPLKDNIKDMFDVVRKTK